MRVANSQSAQGLMARVRARKAARIAGPAGTSALVLLVLSVLISYIDRGNLSIAAPLLETELGIPVSQLGILLSGFFWSYTLMQFACAAFMDRADARRVLPLGFLLWSIATAATGFVNGFAMLLVMRLLLGVGESVTFPCCSKMLVQHVPESRRGLANGAIMAGMKPGPAVGTLGVGLLIAAHGWRPVFIGLGLLGLMWLPAWQVWMPRAPAEADCAASCPPVMLIFRQRAFWGTVVGGFCTAYPLYFMVTWLPFYLVHEHHLAMAGMTRVASLYYLVDASAALATGCVTDLLIRRGKGVGVVRKSAMVLGWTTAAAGFCACTWAGDQHYLASLMLTALGVGTGNSGLFAFSQTLAGPNATGRWVSLQNGFSNLAGVIGPTLTGYTVYWTGHFRVAIAVTAGVCLIGALAWLCLVGELRRVNWAETRFGSA